MSETQEDAASRGNAAGGSAPARDGSSPADDGAAHAATTEAPHVGNSVRVISATVGTPQPPVNQEAALFISAFVDELAHLGVQDVVVSPGSRSTPLSMVFDASAFNLYLDIDERGAAFFALGRAKASGRPVCLVCTSGTAVANYYPALLEASTSRVPLIVLTGDRPHLLRNLGAPQTCDQIKIFGDAMRFFNEMPLPAADTASIAYARQMARESFIQATGELPGPVHLNFPVDDPLKPDLQAEGLFTIGRGPLDSSDRPGGGVPDGMCPMPLLRAARALDRRTIDELAELFSGKRGIVLCGEGCGEGCGVGDLVRFSELSGFPLIADPLSGLRGADVPCIIDNYDNFFGTDDCPPIDLIIRFGRWPVSKRCYSSLERLRPTQVVVDTAQTRDFNASTDIFVCCTPAEFARSFLDAYRDGRLADDTSDILSPDTVDGFVQHALFAPTGYLSQWLAVNERAAAAIARVEDDPGTFEGPYIRRMLALVPDDALLFSASSMSIRAIDTFLTKPARPLRVMCNRGLNGIDGTLSSALGAALDFASATLLTGDLAFLHDLNALHLARELAWLAEHSFVIVLSDNRGGGIFELLPQRSAEPYFERLFLTPQNIDFSGIAQGFGICYEQPKDVGEFADAYERAIARPGLTLIRIETPLDGLADCYRPYQASR